jgi:hypothetical protein
MMNASRSYASSHSSSFASPLAVQPPPGITEQRTQLTTRFGDLVDVRNRGVLRLARLVGIQVPGKAAPAVVRLWSGDTCREMSAADARALAAQLLEAARHAELQNRD